MLDAGPTTARELTMSGFRRVRPIAALLGALAIGAFSGSTTLATTGGPTVLAVARDGPASIHGSGAFRTLASLKVPAGRWLVTSTLAISNATNTGATTTCKLVMGADLDTAIARNGELATFGGSAPLVLINAHSFSSVGTAALQCTSTGATGAQKASSIRLTATKIGKLTRRTIGGSSVTTGSGSPRVFLAQRDTSQNIPGDASFHTLGSLSVPAGFWLFSGKVEVALTTGATTTIDCELFTNPRIDQTTVAVSTTSGRTTVGSDRVAVGLLTENHFVSTGTVSLACRSADAFHASILKIAAFKAGTVASTDIDGGSDGGQGSGNPFALFAVRDGPTNVPLGGGTNSVGSIPVQAGNWAISAKLFLSAVAFNAGVAFTVTCQLTAGSDADSEFIELFPQDGMDTEAMSLQTVHHFAADSSLSIDCSVSGGPGTVAAHDIRFIAVRAGSLTSTAL